MAIAAGLGMPWDAVKHWVHDWEIVAPAGREVPGSWDDGI